MTPEQIDEIITYANTPILLTAEEDAHLSRCTDPSQERHVIYQGQPVQHLSGEFLTKPDVWQGLIDKVLRAEREFTNLCLHEWRDTLRKAASSDEALFLYISENEIDGLQNMLTGIPDKIIHLTFKLASDCLSRLGMEVGTAIVRHDDVPADRRDRAESSLQEILINDFAYVAENLGSLTRYEPGEIFSKASLRHKFQQDRNNFFFGRNEGLSVRHCPAHGLIGTVMASRREESPLLTAHRRITDIYERKAKRPAGKCPFNHGGNKAAESLVSVAPSP
jgi:hypothetical protein